MRSLHHRRRDRARRKFLNFFRPLRVEPLEDRSLLATIVVTTELDIVNAADNLTSLREAVTQANNQATNPGHTPLPPTPHAD